MIAPIAKLTLLAAMAIGLALTAKIMDHFYFLGAFRDLSLLVIPPGLGLLSLVFLISAVTFFALGVWKRTIFLSASLLVLLVPLPLYIISSPGNQLSDQVWFWCCSKSARDVLTEKSVTIDLPDNSTLLYLIGDWGVGGSNVFTYLVSSPEQKIANRLPEEGVFVVSEHVASPLQPELLSTCLKTLSPVADSYAVLRLTC